MWDGLQERVADYMKCAKGWWLNEYPSELCTFSPSSTFSKRHSKLPVSEHAAGTTAYPAVAYHVETESDTVWILCLKMLIDLSPPWEVHASRVRFHRDTCRPGFPVPPAP